MAAKKVGALIKEARTAAGLTQEKLAKAVKGITANEISKAERGELSLTQEQLKAIAKATGVTQKSLLEAAAGKSSSAKTGTSKTSTSKTSTSKTSSGTSMKVSAAEKKLVELYRAADTETKKKVVSILKGDSSDAGDLLNSLIEGALGQIMKK